MCCAREGIWKGDIMVADIEELEEMDASELHARRLNAKAVSNAEKKWKLHIPSRRWNSQILLESTASENIHFNPGASGTRRRTRNSSRKIRWNTFSNPTSRRLNADDEKAKSDFWTFTWKNKKRHHVQPRVKLYVPREESFPIPLKYIDVTRTTCTSLDVLLEKNIEDYWNVDGEKEVSDRIRKICSTNGKATGRIHMVREETYMVSKLMSDAAKKKAKQRRAIEKPKLDKARQLRGILFIQPNDEEFKLTMKAARWNLNVPMPAAMPCKIPIKSSGEIHRNIGTRKTKYACIVDADESTRPRLAGAGHKPHQDHITAKGMNSTTHYSLVHIHSDASSLKNQMQRQQWRKNGENWRNPGMAADEGQKQERSDRWSKE